MCLPISGQDRMFWCFYFTDIYFLKCTCQGLEGNPEFARRKVKVSSEESRTLLRGKPESVKTQKRAALRLPCNLVNNINLSY